MHHPGITEYAQVAWRIAEAERIDPKLQELKEHLRSAVAWVNRAANDAEMAQAINAENEAIQALIQHIYG